MEDKADEVRECKFKVGDKVKVVKYGGGMLMSKKHWQEIKVYDNKSSGTPKNIISEDEDFYLIDVCPEVVGKDGIIYKAHLTQNIPYYAINGIEGKSAWYNEQQLELILT